ncbi:SRPBCC family protein [Ideonella sp. 4Y16]|uniref:SRPBCC family protein n=1 Tax=Ideonella alba TaxID=2824118 RepID=UPI001B394BF9|nr:SRPBCC family protein [Ideonella alba]MBQ0945615.1 SRPBCC family protein [Ideonella alba]
MRASRALLPMLLALACRAGGEPTVAPTDVQVQRQGSHFSIDVVMHAAVPPPLAFEVLTDFDHMARFVPNLSESRVLERRGLTWRVAQKGAAHWGPITLPFESVRELQLDPPREIRAHALSGSAAAMDTLMQLEPEPGGTRLHYHAEVEPGRWFPPGLGPALVQHETAEQFSALLREMAARRAPQGVSGIQPVTFCRAETLNCRRPQPMRAA